MNVRPALRPGAPRRVCLVLAFDPRHPKKFAAWRGSNIGGAARDSLVPVLASLGAPRKFGEGSPPAEGSTGHANLSPPTSNKISAPADQR